MALLALGCALSLLAIAAPSRADSGPHVVGMGGMLTSNCAACHRTHTGQAPDLLKTSSVEALCYTCHGSAAGGSNLDVADGVAYSDEEEASEERKGTMVGALRGGGFKYALIDSAHPEGQQGGGSDPDGDVPVLSELRPVTSAHSTNGSPQIDWGNGPIDPTPLGTEPTKEEMEQAYGKTIELTCVSCHDPHGNGNYRILRGLPGGGEGNLNTTEVNITEVGAPNAPKQYTTTNYWDVEEEHDPAFIEDISAWCATCHTRYLSETSYEPSGDAVFTDRHISGQKAQGSASCIQCHLAHGSNASVGEAEAGKMAVHSPEPVPAPPGSLGSMLLRVDDRGTCRMCHAGESPGE